MAKIERVIEVFECLLDIDKPCEDTCSYSLGDYRCDTTRLYKETLDLLKEQHAEIERLRQEKDDAVTVIQDLKKEIKELRMTDRA